MVLGEFHIAIKILRRVSCDDDKAETSTTPSVPSANIQTPVPEKASEPAGRNTSGQVYECKNITL